MLFYFSNWIKECAMKFPGASINLLYKDQLGYYKTYQLNNGSGQTLSYSLNRHNESMIYTIHFWHITSRVRVISYKKIAKKYDAVNEGLDNLIFDLDKDIIDELIRFMNPRKVKSASF